MDFETRESGLLVPKKADLIVGGRYLGKIIRAGKVVDEFECKNIIVNQGLDTILGVMFTGVAQITAWYLALYTGNYVPVSTDTAASIVANSTEMTGYTATTRVPYTGTEATQQVTNAAAQASFTFNASATIYGAFLSSASAKQSTSGVLFSAAQFATAKSVVAADVLSLTYQFSATSS